MSKPSTSTFIAAIFCAAAFNCQAAGQGFTDPAAFAQSIATQAYSVQTFGFEEFAAGSLIASGTSVGGFSLIYDLAGDPAPEAMVTTITGTGNSLGLNGLDQAWMSGDAVRFEFDGPINAFGIWVITSSDDSQAGDLLLTGAGISVANSLLMHPQAGVDAWFLGLASDEAFGSVTLESNDPQMLGLFVFNIDDVTLGKAPAAIPEPGTLGLVLPLLAMLLTGKRKGWRRKAVYPLHLLAAASVVSTLTAQAAEPTPRLSITGLSQDVHCRQTECSGSLSIDSIGVFEDFRTFTITGKNLALPDPQNPSLVLPPVVEIAGEVATIIEASPSKLVVMANQALVPGSYQIEIKSKTYAPGAADALLNHYGSAFVTLGATGATGRPGSQGETGPAGPAGPQGQQGQQGPAGQAGLNGRDGRDGVSGYVVASGTTQVVTFKASQAVAFTANCPGSKKALGGGVHREAISAPLPQGANSYEIVVLTEEPAPVGCTTQCSGWQVVLKYVGDSGLDRTISVTPRAICADVNS